MRVFRDTWLVFERYMGMTLRNPAWIVIGMLQPVLYLFLFAPLLKSVAGVHAFPSGGAYNVFVPGLVIQLGAFGAVFVGFTLISELRSGVVERMRVTPVSRIALLLGRALRDILVLVVESLVLVLLALPFGLSINAAGLAVILALQALIGLLMASLSYTLALVLRSEDRLAGVLTTATLPLLLLSGVLLPLSLAPDWLRVVADFNPLSYAVDAARAVFNDHLTDVSVARGVVVVGVLAVLSVLLAARSFNRAIS
jgi:ABC-2 type transport system permease protein